MMQQAVEDDAGDDSVAEYLAPGTETLIAGDDERAALITARHQLKEQVGALAVDRQIANLIDDQQLWLSEQLQAFLQPAFGQGPAQGGDERSGTGRTGNARHSPAR